MPTLHGNPVCRGCHHPIEYDAVFAPICGQKARHGDDHVTCPSSAWHGYCLMEWRERIERAEVDLHSIGDIPAPVVAILRDLGLL
jgi:hypothetical protein